MTDAPPPPESGRQQAANFAMFLLKLLGFLAGLTAFGFVIFWMRRQLG